MSNILKKVINGIDPLQLQTYLDDAEGEYMNARQFLRVEGQKVEWVSMHIASKVDEAFSKLQELEAVLDTLSRQRDTLRKDKIQFFLEKYQYKLSSRDAQIYADAENDVQMFCDLIQKVAHVRNMFLSLMKGLDALSWQIQNITKLRSSGYEGTIF